MFYYSVSMETLAQSILQCGATKTHIFSEVILGIPPSEIKCLCYQTLNLRHARSDAMRLPELKHEKWHSFHPPLLGCSLSEPTHDAESGDPTQVVQAWDPDKTSLTLSTDYQTSAWTAFGGHSSGSWVTPKVAEASDIMKWKSRRPTVPFLNFWSSESVI